MSSSSHPQKSSALGGFAYHMRETYGRIKWPTRTELIAQSINVIVISVLLAAFVALADFLLSKAFTWLISL